MKAALLMLAIPLGFALRYDCVITKLALHIL